MKDEFIRIRIESRIKKEVETALEQNGLNVSDAFSLFCHSVIRHNGLPIDVQRPLHYPDSQLGVNVIALWLVEQLTNNKMQIIRRFDTSDDENKFFEFLILDANNYRIKSGKEFNYSTTSQNATSSHILIHEFGKFYLLGNYYEEDEGLFLYFQPKGEWNPAKIKFLGNGKYSKNPPFETLFLTIGKILSSSTSQ